MRKHLLGGAPTERWQAVASLIQRERRIQSQCQRIASFTLMTCPTLNLASHSLELEDVMITSRSIFSQDFRILKRLGCIFYRLLLQSGYIYSLRPPTVTTTALKQLEPSLLSNFREPLLDAQCSCNIWPRLSLLRQIRLRVY